MGATASLTPNELTVEPGSAVTCQIRVRNTGHVVDQFTLEVLGEALAWASVDPPTLSLLPDGEGSATVTFAISRGFEVAAGTYPFAVKATSKEDPAGSVTEEGTLVVGTLRDMFIELLPRTARARRAAQYEVAVDNRGNQRLNANLSAVDPNNALRFRLGAPALVADPNTATFSKLAVAPVRRFWKGPSKTHSFQVLADAPPGPPITAEGVLLQEALLPPWLWKALLLLLALLILAAILWFALLKPAITSAARKAVAVPLAQQAAQTAAIKKAQAAQAGAQNQQAAAVKQLQQQAHSVSPTFTPLPVGGVTVTSVTTVDGRLSASVPAGQSSSAASYTVPTGATLAITDLILENPAGDSGTLSLEQNSVPLLQINLDNFRDLDYHFVSAPELSSGQRLVLAVTCNNQSVGGQPPKVCTPGVFYSGTLTSTSTH